MYQELSKASDKGRLVVDRAEAHTLRLSMLYAILDTQAEIQPLHLDAAYALWRYSEASALRLFGVEELCREAQLILDHLRNKVDAGATRTELQNRVFSNRKTGAEIQVWLRALEENQLARYQTERNDNGNLIERWFAIHYSGPQPQDPSGKSAKKSRKSNEFATNSQKNANSSSRSSKGSPSNFGPSSHNSHFLPGANENQSSAEQANPLLKLLHIYTLQKMRELSRKRLQ
jgi:hypothetical protein